MRVDRSEEKVRGGFARVADSSSYIRENSAPLPGVAEAAAISAA
jgi:hypothetical protein